MTTALAITEDQFQARITDTCERFHLKWHHETDSRRTRRGWPDLFICGPGGILVLELKGPRTAVTPEQAQWIVALGDAGVVAYVARPADWDRVLADLRRIAEHPRPTI